MPLPPASPETLSCMGEGDWSKEERKKWFLREVWRSGEQVGLEFSQLSEPQPLQTCHTRHIMILIFQAKNRRLRGQSMDACLPAKSPSPPKPPLCIRTLIRYQVGGAKGRLSPSSSPGKGIMIRLSQGSQLWLHIRTIQVQLSQPLWERVVGLNSCNAPQ